jgi:hypothetical protein
MMGSSIEGGCLCFVAQADVVPLLGVLRTSAVIGAPLDSGRKPASSMTDRPRPSFERRPAKGGAVPKAGMPFTVTSKEEGGR